MNVFEAIRSWWTRPSRKQLLQAVNDMTQAYARNDNNWAKYVIFVLRRYHLNHTELMRARQYLRKNHPSASPSEIGLINCGDVPPEPDMTSKYIAQAYIDGKKHGEFCAKWNPVTK